MTKNIENNKTPIEIVLAIDEDGFTTASAIYQWLEMEPANFSRWCKTNIINNSFFKEKIDYFVIKFDAETPTGGKIERTDYKVSSEMAKMLCMTSKSPKAIEAHQYFLNTEKALVVLYKEVKAQQELMLENQAKFAAQQKTMLIEQEEMKRDITEYKKTTDARMGVIESGYVTYEPSRWVKFICDRISLLAQHYEDAYTHEPYTFKKMFHFILDELEWRNPGFQDQIRETVRIYETNTGKTDGSKRPLQMIDYNTDLRYKFNHWVNHELYEMGIIDEEEDQDNEIAMLRRLFLPIAKF